MSVRLDHLVASLASRLGEPVELVAGVAGDADRIVVTDVEHRSDRVAAGQLFACIPGRNADGHDFAALAVEAGAVALLVERRLELPVPQLVVDSVRRALGPAAASVHGDPSRRLDVVGVTGTNGKTTVVHVLAALAGAAGRSTRTIGTLTGERTTPEAPELQRLLADAVNEGADLVAMEVSSHALDLHRVDGVAFRAAAFTNLGRDHLDHHGTLEAYFAAKARLFEPDRCGVAVIDVDDPHGAALAADVEVPVVATGLSTVEVLEVGPRGSRVRWRGHTLVVPLPGRFNLVDVVVAAELAMAVGIDDAVVAEAVASLEPVPGRFERVDDGDGPTVLVDYAHTPEGLEAALTAARDLTDRDLVVVVGAGGDRDREKRPRMGEVARALADRVVVTSDNPRSEDPAAIAAAVVSGMTRPPDLVELDRRLAIRHALAHARPGDVVVIAGKGHETTQTFADTAVDFDDRLVARAELARLRERVR